MQTCSISAKLQPHSPDTALVSLLAKNCFFSSQFLGNWGSLTTGQCAQAAKPVLEVLICLLDTSALESDFTWLQVQHIHTTG